MPVRGKLGILRNIIPKIVNFLSLQAADSNVEKQKFPTVDVPEFRRENILYVNVKLFFIYNLFYFK